MKPLDLRGSKRDILVTITAAMETLVELGRDCKTRLPVYGGRPEAMVPCSNFIEHVKVWRLPALSAYRALLDDKDWAMANMPGVEKVGKSADEVADLEKHILLRLRAVRRELEER
ncbi:MAG: hypothetical protein O9327_03235 [Polaromonas sp.]|nr:hypothetical protein [Polaromonas sp.]